MTYEFKCSKCNRKQEIDIPISDYDNQVKNGIFQGICPSCKNVNSLKRLYFFSSSIHVPEWMRASKEADTFTSLRWRMKHSTPSGRKHYF